MNIKLFLIYLVFVGVGCTSTNTVAIKNEQKGKLIATYQLKISGTKRIILDTVSTPKPQYTQLLTDTAGTRYFTFLNTYTNSIYFYNYESLKFIKKITYDKKGANGIQSPKGYYIKNMDSIYLYNMPKTEIVLANDKSIIRSKISLRGEGDPNWYLNYPQYFPETVNPFLATPGKLIISGRYFFSIPESAISKFKFTAQLDFKSGKVNFIHTYPRYLYGSGYNWEGGLFTTAFTELHPDGDKLIYSFPVSHDLYIAGLNTEVYRQVYAGSNFAGTINSMDLAPSKTPGEMTLMHYARQDLYAGIKYDKYRKIYYRFLLKGIPDASIHIQKEQKPIVVIVMDDRFHYLGETVIGTGEEWHWENSFVTKEGLNIEYIEKDLNESAMTLKIFTLKKI